MFEVLFLYRLLIIRKVSNILFLLQGYGKNREKFRTLGDAIALISGALRYSHGQLLEDMQLL
ncbi:hypothetical protein [Paenibacillus konkukensis]|uniref:hypothetical protein n=1 Tax=Paenibacillus konkukensis TaxID=2020716 RepID=UPI00201D5C19|nr:hypothetical protein [Paenibacillus konkukensis]